MLQVALTDVQTNPSIANILPDLVQYLQETVSCQQLASSINCTFFTAHFTLKFQPEEGLGVRLVSCITTLQNAHSSFPSPFPLQAQQLGTVHTTAASAGPETAVSSLQKHLTIPGPLCETSYQLPCYSLDIRASVPPLQVLPLFPLMKSIVLNASYLHVGESFDHWHVRHMAAICLAEIVRYNLYNMYVLLLVSTPLGLPSSTPLGLPPPQLFPLFLCNTDSMKCSWYQYLAETEKC